MSTNISNVWVIPTQNYKKLVKLSNELEALWSKTYINDYVEALVNWPWTHMCAKTLAKEDPEFVLCREIARYALVPVIAAGKASPVWTMSSREKGMLEFLMGQYLEQEKKSLSAEARDALLQVFSDLYESYSMSSNQLTFIKGPGHLTFMVGYGMTREMRTMLDSRYKNFDYTNSTDMDIECFPMLCRFSFVLKRIPKKVRYKIAWIAQRHRGKVWNKIFDEYGGSRMKLCGLARNFTDDWEIRNVGKAVVEVLTKAASATPTDTQNYADHASDF